ncbi:MAG: Fic family protein [Alphaproteobacteria bacterium]|nr:Fic family protein [Alphaproteobacteria bacterium]
MTGIRDEEGLESALDRPRHLFFYGENTVDITAMAVAYAYGLATNRPFFDGNKRIAMIVSFL